MFKLVIVESPTKAKTIKNFLPKGYLVLASMGHVRDLPQSAADTPAEIKGKKWATLGVNIENDFEPVYVVPKTKKKIVQGLKEHIEGAGELLLATDEDREGESISWHLVELLRPKVPVRRLVFHEITREAIAEALASPRDVDDKLVRAQETRRILDRLVGYTLSPLLWKKIAYGLSAGRVQSVAVRLLVARERCRRAFVKGAYWDMLAELAKGSEAFEAVLTTVAGRRVASGRDFDEHTGKIIAGRDVVLLSEKEVLALKERLEAIASGMHEEAGGWRVTRVERKPVTRSPAPPFITSTLQQEANRKLGLSARDTMRSAQALYENGYITYMRTDSVHLSEQALSAARACVKELYGGEYLSPSPRQYKTKVKGAQEAHEAIRPAGGRWRLPKDTGLSGREFSLYDLIWKRAVATQMAECRQTHVTADIMAGEAVFQASGKRIDFPGFFRAYVEGSDDPDAAIEEQELVLPELKEGDAVSCRKIVPLSHETKPPARYTEATLVKTLEAEGIGRPSTYASILGTIEDRGYVVKTGQALIPTFTAFAVTGLLEKHFPTLVDPKFTARMEEVLDDIAEGRAEWLPYLRQFYLGGGGLKSQVETHEDEIDPNEARTVGIEGITAKIRIGRYGAYLETEKDGGTLKANIPLNMAPADLDDGKVALLLSQRANGPATLGTDPTTGLPVYVLLGAYGPYLQLGEVVEKGPKPKRVSLPRGLKMEDVTIEKALSLLSLPRELGTHPEGGRVAAALGRFGPFVVHDRGEAGKEYRSLRSGDDPTTVTFERALELLSQPKGSRSRRGPAAPVRELGDHPGDGQPVAIFKGPYGHYVRWGKIHAGIPKNRPVEGVTLEEAVGYLEEKAASRRTRPTRRKTA